MNVGNVVMSLKTAAVSPSISYTLSESAGFAAEILKVLMDQEAVMQRGQIRGPRLDAMLAYVKTLPGWSEADFPEVGEEDDDGPVPRVQE